MKKDVYELTNPQKSIWLTEQYFSGTAINNIGGTLLIQQETNLKLLNSAINIFIKNNDSLNLKFELSDSSLVQYFDKPNTDYNFEVLEFQNENEISIYAKKLINTPLNITSSQTFDFKLFKLPSGHGGFIGVLHHIISDAATISIVTTEIIQIYSALLKSQNIPEKTNSYLEYINSEKDYIQSERFKKDKDYWDSYLSPLPDIATLPSSNNVIAKDSNSRASRLEYIFDLSIMEKIKNYCNINKISIYNFLIGLYSIYFGKLNSMDTFTIGTPILNRSTFSEKHTSGMFISTSLLKIDMTKNLLFSDFVKNIAKDCMSMLRHQKYNYQYIVEDVRKKDKSVTNLYDILLSYQITKTIDTSLNIPYVTKWYETEFIGNTLNIHFHDTCDTNTLTVEYDYQINKLSPKDIANMHNRILVILNQVLTKDTSIYDIDIITDEEKQKLLVDFNNTNLEYDKNIPIIKYFEDIALNYPNRNALVFEKNSLTYKELNERANSLAYLLRENGVSCNTIVGIMVERSFEMIIAILAVLKSGGSYIPIDPDYPQDRVNYMLTDSNASLLLVKKDIKLQNAIKTLNITLNNDFYNTNKTNLTNISSPDDLSYLIYTSGSTGMPKGVMLTQKNLSNFYNAMSSYINYFKDGKSHNIVSITTVSFDIFIFETIMSLTKGLCLFMTTETEQKVSENLEKLICENSIEIIQTTPSVMKFHLDNFKNKENIQSLKYVILAGEPLPKFLVDTIKNTIPGVTIYNGYGPSETTIFSNVENVTNLEKISVGRPVANSQVYILDKNKKLLPPGFVGEIYISGDCVGKGYINKPEQTQKSYLNNPFKKDSIMYKVGDLGAFDANGSILCFGRIDNQVKLRGLRIELDEIEKTMLDIYSITNAVVVKKTVNNKEVLCAYYTSSMYIEEANIKAVLKSKLPSYMVPQFFIKLENMPYTPNGKIDKKNLPMPCINSYQKEFIHPRNDLDKQLIEILQSILKIDTISMDDNVLSLGGDSLTAITLITKISSKFNVEISIKDILSCDTLAQISDIIEQNINIEHSKIKIEKAPICEYYPLSSAQSRIYYDSMMIGDSNIVYNMPGGILVDSLLDAKRIKEVFEKIIQRHSSLRTSFIVQDNKVVQKVVDKIDFDIPIYYDKEENKNEILKGFSKPFDLSKGNLLRVEIYYLDNQKTLILVDAHHIILDGTSLNNLIIEFNRLYNGVNLKKIPIQYIDYAVWEKSYNESDKIKEAENYWLDKFKNYKSSGLNLPYDYKQGASGSFNGDKISKVIDSKEYKKIEKYAKKIGLSPYMFFISVFFILLYKYTGQNEITLGSPIANRNINETKRMLGVFINNIVVKANINATSSFQEFANSIKKQVLNDLSNEPYPFDMLVKKLNLSGSGLRNPLFDVLFTYQNHEENIIKFDNTEAKVLEIRNKISKFNLSMEIKPKTHTINFEYCTDLFKATTIEKFYEHFMNVIHSIMENNNTIINDISILSSQEKERIIYEFNKTNFEYDKNKTISKQFEKQVINNSSKTAVVCNNETLTYDELNKKSNQLARILRKNGLKPNDVVGVLYPRTLDLVVALLAVMKSGACYIPIDPAYPQGRIEYMLSNSNAKLLLTTKELSSTINYENKLCATIDSLELSSENNSNLENINKPEDLVYLIYTSGSTGLPKGVLLTHKNLTNFIAGVKNIIDFNKDKNLLSITTICFDIFGLEIWGALSSGMTLILANEEEQNVPSKLNELCMKNHVHIIQTTPSRYSLIFNETSLDFFENLTDILVGGEPLTDKVLTELQSRSTARIFNMYGPTETTIWSTIKEETNIQEITIGKPIANTQCYVLDNNLQVVPIGVTGELYISGDGVGNGYKDRDDITNERYIPNPFIAGTKMYKTGDICFYDENGELHCLGRIDNQIKIRGLRIELDEIEKRILEIPNVKEVKVVKQVIADREVISAYYISSQRISTSQFRKYLTKFLPKYMIPSYFTAMDKFPYTPNGKIDKNSLPIPDGMLPNSNYTYTPPSTDLEVKLVSIWEDVLNIKPIGIKDNFFELGGDSILAMNLNIKLLSMTDKLSFSDIFSYPTISELAKKIQSDLSDNSREDLSILNEKYNEIFEKNMTIPTEIHCKKDNNVLLTGGTGFFGIHFMEEFLNNETGNIYLIIRKEHGFTIKEKLLSKMHYYFGEKYDHLLDSRIFAVQGNISEDGFGLNQKDLFDLANSVNIIVNSAAKVSHYGSYNDFYNINVKSVEKIINFASTFNKKLFHISTLSISGNAFMEKTLIQQKFNNEIIFTEDKFYVEQTLDNVYVKSKFEAETKILDAIQNGVDAYILRLGNLMPRFIDGKFQENVSDNAYIDRLKAFYKLEVLPESLSDLYLEFTPIDYAAKSTLEIIEHTSSDNRIYHLYNHNHVFINVLLKLLNELNLKIHQVSNEEFKRKIKSTIISGNMEISTLINELDKNLNLNYSSNIKINSAHTIKLLELYGFVWPVIDKRYLKNVLTLIEGEIKKNENN